MRFLGALILSTALLSSNASNLLAQKAVRPLTTADIAERASPATATVYALSAGGDTLGQGSGFLIRDDGVIVTNFHVLRGASSAVIVLNSRERYSRVRLLDADSALDIALLKIPGAAMPVLSARMTTPRVGERVVAIGTPLGLSRSVSEGIVSATRVVGGRELIQITAAISPGSSGGAVLDASGHVFAVSTSYIASGQELNFAVPVRYALGMLNDLRPERSLAQVFGGIAQSGEGSASERRSSSETATSQASTARNPQPLTNLNGTFKADQAWVDSLGALKFTQSGTLIATDHVGLLVLANTYGHRPPDPAQVYFAARWATNSAGDVVLAAGGATYDGYQTTDSGFIAQTKITVTTTPYSVYLSGVPTRIPLSHSEGLYSIAFRTQFSVDGRPVTEPTDWTGEAAVAVARDSIYLDIFLRNAKGGTTGLIGHAALDGEQHFNLTSDSVSLSGRLEAGMLYGDWVDRRGNGMLYSGRFHGSRQ